MEDSCTDSPISRQAEHVLTFKYRGFLVPKTARLGFSYYTCGFPEAYVRKSLDETLTEAMAGNTPSLCTRFPERSSFFLATSLRMLDSIAVHSHACQPPAAVLCVNLHLGRPRWYLLPRQPRVVVQVRVWILIWIWVRVRVRVRVWVQVRVPVRVRVRVRPIARARARVRFEFGSRCAWV